MKWECPSLGGAGSSPAKFSSFLGFLLITLKLSFFLLSVKCYSVTLPLKSDDECMLSSLDHQPKRKTPKADSRLHAMKKSRKRQPFRPHWKSAKELVLCLCRAFLAPFRLKDELATTARSLAATSLKQTLRGMQARGKAFVTDSLPVCFP